MNKMRINRDKIMKAIIASLLFVYLFATLINSQATYKPFLMVFTILVMVWAFYNIVKSEEMMRKHLRRWRKARERGIKVNVAIGSLKAFTQMAVLLGLGRMVNGQTLTELRLRMSGFDIAHIAIVMLVISVLYGVLSWRENEKKFVAYQFRLSRGDS